MAMINEHPNYRPVFLYILLTCERNECVDEISAQYTGACDFHLPWVDLRSLKEVVVELSKDA